MTPKTNIFFIKILGCYQKNISPLLAPRCRFYPSCSSYAIECFTKQTLALALTKTMIRLLKCQPFHPGGVDLP